MKTYRRHTWLWIYLHKEKLSPLYWIKCQWKHFHKSLSNVGKIADFIVKAIATQRWSIDIWAKVVVHSLNHIQHFANPLITVCQASLSFTISQSCSNSCSLSVWCHPTILSSTTHFSSWQSSQRHQVARVLVLKHQSFQLIFMFDFL